jgi:hypothetical protein
MPTLEGVYEYRFVRQEDVNPEIDMKVALGENTASYYARFVSAVNPISTTQDLIDAFATRYDALAVDPVLSEKQREWYRGATRTEERTALVRRKIA